jgi:hypothetical protein
MRGITKVLTAISAVGLAATMTACSSSGGGTPKPEGAFKTLTGQSTTVVAAPTFLSALTSLGVKLGLVGKATMPTPGDLSFPITGGNATIYKKGAVTPYVQGVVDHQGSGFSLTAGSTVVDLENFVVNPGNDSNLTGDVIVNGGTPMKGVRLFDLDGSTLQTPTISKAGVATLSGTTIYLSAPAAAALNSVFKLTGAKALAGDMKVKIGTAIIKATGTS